METTIEIIGIILQVMAIIAIGFLFYIGYKILNDERKDN
jgi:hypothetical protein